MVAQHMTTLTLYYVRESLGMELTIGEYEMQTQ